MANRHPETWYTSTLIDLAGPSNRTECHVLAVLDKMAGTKRAVTKGLPEIAERARLTPNGLRGVLRRLEAAGLVIVDRPTTYYRGNATSYRVNREALIRAACEAAERVNGVDPFPDLEGSTEGSTGLTLNGPEGSTAFAKRVNGVDPTMSTRSKDQSSSAPHSADETHAGPADDDAIRQTLDGIHEDLRPTYAIRGRVQVARERGHTPEAIRAHLVGALSGDGIRSVPAVATAALDDLIALPPRQPGQGKPSRPDWCGLCDERTRLLGMDTDSPVRCCNCHPLMVNDRDHIPESPERFQTSALLALHGGQDDQPDELHAADPPNHRRLVDATDLFAAPRRRRIAQ